MTGDSRRFDASCGACLYWVHRPDLDQVELQQFGECRRHAPVATQATEYPDENNYSVTVWPITCDESDYCGEFVNYYDRKDFVNDLTRWMRDMEGKK